MAKGIARYIVTNGLAGCYMPDHNHGAIQFDTRRELAAYIRAELESLNFPARKIREIKLRNIWRHIARHGSSVAHFSIHHKGYALSFHGLTDSEYREESERED